MVATTGKDPPGRTPRATKRQNTAAETKERHVQLLNKLSNRHHLYLLRDSAALNRYVALSERNAVEPREDGGSATPNPDLVVQTVKTMIVLAMVVEERLMLRKARATLQTLIVFLSLRTPSDPMPRSRRRNELPNTALN
ncbi:hypothetical protein DVH05_011655 [Phytophthora capsici]|nr:hypothetical protein DVH05_011655 [Phytophthora capsici]